MKQKHFIDSHKGVTPIVILLLIAIFNQWENPTAWVYWGLHGSYGVLWVLK
ncbi:MAG: steroid 5-alpha reductase, partial [Chloroflexi bacterium]